MTFRVRAGSTGRNWSGFDAMLYDASAGFSEQQFVRHNVSMQIGRPVLVTSRCDGETLRRLQVPGDVKIIPPGVTRVWETESPTVKLSMYLGPALMLDAAEAMNVKPERLALSPRLHVRDPRIEHIGWAVKAEIESPEPQGRLYGESLGLALAAHLLHAYVPARAALRPCNLSGRRLTRVLEYISENLGNDLGLDELAGIAGISPSHFKVLFKRHAGTPVHQYVLRRRVEYAAELLSRPRAAVAEVAFAAGFANQSHLARSMRRVMGVTPSELREAAAPPLGRHR